MCVCGCGKVKYLRSLNWGGSNADVGDASEPLSGEKGRKGQAARETGWIAAPTAFAYLPIGTGEPQYDLFGSTFLFGPRWGSFSSVPCNIHDDSYIFYY